MTTTTTIPPAQFGKDHYSTLAYIETRTVDYRSKVNAEHMRTDRDRHPQQFAAKKGTAARYALSGIDMHDTKYPTRLADGTERADHDDWDCVLDMIAAGWLASTGGGLMGDVNLIHPDAAYSLTAMGRTVANALRQHKADGGGFGTFTAPEETL